MNSEGIIVTKVPADLGSVIKGKAAAPEALLATDIISKLAELGYDIKQQSALPDGPTSWKPASMNARGVRREEGNIEVLNLVKTAISEGLSSDTTTTPFQLVLGGECCMLPAILSSFWTHHSHTNRKIGLLYIDADCDLTIPGESGSSGNLASMTMTHLTMRDGALDSMRGFTRPDGKAVTDSTNIVLFGLNISTPMSAKREHLAYLFDEGFRVITSKAVASDPIGRAKQALKWLEENGVDDILVHLDVDAIDASSFPLANVPNFSGCGFEEILTAVKVCLSSERVSGLVIAEVNPAHDPGSHMMKRLVDQLIEGFASRSESVRKS